MNHRWFGDSYDIVKRYFLGVLRDVGYEVFCRPYFTGNWDDEESSFLGFIGATRIGDTDSITGKTALLLDPDTGIGKCSSRAHVSVGDIVHETERHNVVTVFDQAFSRNTEQAQASLRTKLVSLSMHGLSACYYDSHARFLFVAQEGTDLVTVKEGIIRTGLPKSRLVGLEDLADLSL